MFSNLKWIELKNLGLLADLLFNTHSLLLRTIRWSCRWALPLIPLHSFENLHELSTDSIGNLTEFLNTLSQCQNLERLKIFGHPITFESDTLVIIPPFSLPCVTHLSLALAFSSTNMLRPIVFQSLVDLQVILSYRLREPLAPVLDMIRRSGVTLKRLGVVNNITGRYRRLAEANLISALKTPYFRELEILEIEEPTSEGRDFVKFLTLPTTSNTVAFGYLMNLERIHLVFQDTLANLLQPLQELIDSRPGMVYDSITTSEKVSLIHISLSISSVPTA